MNFNILKSLEKEYYQRGPISSTIVNSRIAENNHTNISTQHDIVLTDSAHKLIH